MSCKWSPRQPTTSFVENKTKTQTNNYFSKIGIAFYSFSSSGFFKNSKFSFNFVSGIAPSSLSTLYLLKRADAQGNWAMRWIFGQCSIQKDVPPCPTCPLCHGPSTETPPGPRQPLLSRARWTGRGRGGTQNTVAKVPHPALSPPPLALFNFLFWFVWLWYHLNNVVNWCWIPNLLILKPSMRKITGVILAHILLATCSFR